MSTATVTSVGRAGGLVGNNAEGGTITGSESSAQVIVDGNWGVLGGLVAVNNGSIEHSHTLSSASVEATKVTEGSGSDVGGLVGSNYGGDIAFSSSAADVVGYAQVGGLVGYHYNGTISDSSSSGDVMGYDYHMGGLVGKSDYEGTFIVRSYSTGDVHAKWAPVPGESNDPLKNAGGLVGHNSDGAVIRDSYSTGSVDSDEGSRTENVGGLVGWNGWMDGGVIERSYSTGSAKGAKNVGGLVGYNDGGTVEVSYWDTDSSGIPARDPDFGTPQTTEKMHDPDTFSAWDDSTWDIQDGAYPTLWDAATPDGS